MAVRYAKCQYCGSTLAGGRQTCQACGAPVEVVVFSAPPGTGGALLGLAIRTAVMGWLGGF